jgi:D-alanine-D-alanine ligase
MAIHVDPDWWKDIFDDIYLITDARSVCNEIITKREVDIICKILMPDPEDHILDLCGGHGRHSLELCSRGYEHCTLIDYSEYLTGYARRQARELNLPIRVLRTDARETGLASETFEHILIMGNSLGYCSAPDGDRQILAEAYRLLNRGGDLLIDVVNGDAVVQNFNPNAWHEIGGDIIVCRERELDEHCIYARELVMSRKKGLVRDKTYSIRYYHPDTLAALLQETGFKEVEIITDFRPHNTKGDFGFMENRMLGTGIKSGKK